MSKKTAASRGSTFTLRPQPSARIGGGLITLVGGAIAAFAFALSTAVLLLVNGSLTLVAFEILTEANPQWSQRKGMLQFGLFAMPMVLVVVEWMIWDFLRGLFVRERADQDWKTGWRK